MAGWDDVRDLALALPETGETTSRGNAHWQVAGKSFVWERPLRKGDLAALGTDAPTGEILGARTEDEGAKFALIADQPDVYFTIPHFEGYPAVLVRLDAITDEELHELVVDAWLARAPKKLAREFLGG